ncbi:MAG: hypothetical protein UY95_C0010G0009 [Parcubacteria group bacterium GW2011_GWA2_56_7]|nr:MAG: hypothetical protein UY95_C0010G0009 [Parcubacteria group bacterium GW2011_GWA2_56_7]
MATNTSRSFDPILIAKATIPPVRQSDFIDFLRAISGDTPMVVSAMATLAYFHPRRAAEAWNESDAWDGVAPSGDTE